MRAELRQGDPAQAEPAAKVQAAGLTTPEDALRTFFTGLGENNLDKACSAFEAEGSDYACEEIPTWSDPEFLAEMTTVDIDSTQFDNFGESENADVEIDVPGEAITFAGGTTFSDYDIEPTIRVYKHGDAWSVYVAWTVMDDYDESYDESYDEGSEDGSDVTPSPTAEQVKAGQEALNVAFAAFSSEPWFSDVAEVRYNGVMVIAAVSGANPDAYVAVCKAAGSAAAAAGVEYDYVGVSLTTGPQVAAWNMVLSDDCVAL